MRVSTFVITSALALWGAAAHADTQLRSGASWDAGAPVTAVAALNEQGWEIYSEANYILPGGYSASPIFDFGMNPAKIDALRAELFVQPGALCNAGVYAIDVATSPLQTIGTRFFPDQYGIVDLPGQDIYKASIILYSPTVLGTRCLMRFSGLAQIGGTDGGNTDTAFQLLGAIHYQGGFVSDLSIDVPNTNKVTQFKLSIPSFCHDAEILGASTVTEGQLDASRLIDSATNTYEVNGSSGSRISAIKLQMNGPIGQACDIPVYTKIVQ